MNINSIGSGVSPTAPQSSPGSSAVSELQRQRDILVKQLDEVKSKPKKSEAEQKAAEKQVKALEKQIAAIDQKIQKASQNKGSEAPAKSENSQRAKAGSQLHENPLKPFDEEDEKKEKSPFESIGNIIDVYV